MRPENLRTKVFLDSGNVEETRQIIDVLGFLDGQTTNPTLIAKNPTAQQRLAIGDRFTAEEIWEFYREVVSEISTLIPEGSVSVEVYAEQNSTTDELLKQGREMFHWVPNAHIKYPVIPAGLEAAKELVQERMRVNMTLCFSQEQAAAVYAATKGALKGDVFVSPFVGRLDDKGINGMDLIRNIIQMYGAGDKHVQLLAASIRNLDHLLYSLQMKCDIITAPFKILKEWAEGGMRVPEEDYDYPAKDLSPIGCQVLDFGREWREFNVFHPLTNVGLERFAADWKNLIRP